MGVASGQVAEFGVLGIIFALVPGYIADLVFRACWGMPKGDEFDRSLRAIIWSVLGLVLFAAVFRGPPNFIVALIPGAPQAPEFNWSLVGAFAFDVLFCCGAAFVTGMVAQWNWLHQKFSGLFKYSLTFESPWDHVWTRRDAKGREIRVRTKDDTTYIGKALVASQGASDERELILQNPFLVQGTEIVPMMATKFIYLRNDEIKEIQFSVNQQEKGNGGKQGE
jgi:hypothetical protein